MKVNHACLINGAITFVRFFPAPLRSAGCEVIEIALNVTYSDRSSEKCPEVQRVDTNIATGHEGYECSAASTTAAPRYRRHIDDQKH